ncbi:hypothetical protein Ahy_B03g065247 [Arachis hypogaea]|uniref:At2g35280-like TPR domain-containing protein n=1 Tax=Arachis hypogaea TaxID=3818 RepID=A0A445A153_ARAHY|nr:hypothetical protein Ahy_B03g065247 [Arachis hypogaea]
MEKVNGAAKTKEGRVGGTYEKKGNAIGRTQCPLKTIPFDIWACIGFEFARCLLPIPLWAACNGISKPMRHSAEFSRSASVGMVALFWLGHYRGGIQTLTEAAELGDVGACYLSAMLLLWLDEKDEEEIHRGYEFFDVVREFGAVKRCREVFSQVFVVPWSEITPTDPVEAIACRYGSCPTRGTMTVASDLSDVSCVQCLAEYEATCKVFLDAGSSDAVYQHAMMWQIRLVSFLFYLDWLERQFLDRCVEEGNADAILRQGLTEYFWIGRRGIRMELLARASREGSIESGYLFAMLLLCEHQDEEEVQRGVEMLEFVRTSRKVERCREFFTDIFWKRWVD